MQSGAWAILYNAVLLLFWFAAWNGADRNVFFNPYIGTLHRWAGEVTGRLGRWMGTHSDRLTAAGVFILLLIGRSALVAVGGRWHVQMGFLGGDFIGGSLFTALTYSPLSFALFLFQLWSLSLLYAHARPGGISPGNAIDTLTAASRPFTSVRVDLRPPLLLGFGMTIALVLQFSAGALPEAGSPAGIVGLSLARALVVTMAAWTDMLLVLRSILGVLIIASWVAMFAGSHAMASVSRDWLDAFMGPARRYPLRVGMLDLAPLVLLLLLGWVHGALMTVLIRSYRMLG